MTKEHECMNNNEEQGKEPHNTIQLHSWQLLFPKKYELPWVGLEPTTFHSRCEALYKLSYQGSWEGMSSFKSDYKHNSNQANIFLNVTCAEHSNLEPNLYEMVEVMKPPRTPSSRLGLLFMNNKAKGTQLHSRQLENELHWVGLKPTALILSYQVL